MNLEQVLAQSHAALPDLSIDLIDKIVYKIDLLKVQGHEPAMALSKFDDYLGFLGISNSKDMLDFFVKRWEDPVVWSHCVSDVTDAVYGMFTPPKIEFFQQEKPFYEQGTTKLPPGVNYNPDGSTIRRDEGDPQRYYVYIIRDLVPNEFITQVPNDQVMKVLEEGLPQTTEDAPHRLYCKAYDIMAAPSEGGYVYTGYKQPKYTLLSVNTEYLKLDYEVLSGRNVRSVRSNAPPEYQYIGNIPPEAFSVYVP